MSTDGRIRFEILGSLRVLASGQELDLGANKQRAVMAMLLLSTNRPVSPATIIDGIWADQPPENGANVVQKYVAGLRRVLEPDRSPRTAGQLIAWTEAGYVLAVGDRCLDAMIFRQAVARAHDLRAQGHLGSAAEALREADAMWQGEPLAGLSGPAIDRARRSLLDSRAAAREVWAEIELALGHHAMLIPMLSESVTRFPLREGLRYLHILALYRSGRQAEALASYDEARRLLAEEFGVDPGEPLRELHRRIVQADPALLAEPAAADRPAGQIAAVVMPQPVAVPSSSVFAPATTDPPPERVPESSSTPSRTMILGIAGLAVPLASCGFATWLVMAFFAAYRRSWLVGLSAVGYLAAVGVASYDIFSYPESTELAGFAVLAILINAFGGALQGALLGFGVLQAPPDPQTVAKIAAKVRREVARDVMRADTRCAAALGIGRPHLLRRFNDGGLVDINLVPMEVLTGLGLSPSQAHAVLHDRYHNGPLTSPDDLVTRNLLSRNELDRIRDYLIVSDPISPARLDVSQV